MFNVFKKEQIEKEEHNRSIQEVKQKKQKDKRKKILPDLVNNYDKRIKSFIIDMAQSPVHIKDYTSPIDNVRQKFMEDQIEKIKGKKGFIFKSFQTEKDRINEYLKEKEIIEKINSKIKNKAENVKLIQPNMRFRARTDLERIYDAVNGYSLGRASKWILNRQLKDLDLNTAVNTKNKRDSAEMDSFSQNYNGDINDFIEPKETEKVEKKKKRKAVDNSEAKNIMSELHLKTHFKAASVYTIKNRSSRNQHKSLQLEEENIDSKSCLGKINMINENQQPLFRKPNILTNLNINPFNLKTHNNINRDKLDYLQTISILPSLNHVLESNLDNRNGKKKVKFSKNNSGIEYKGNDNENTTSKHEERRKDEEILLIDNQPYSRNQFDVLSKVVLRKCNFTHEKNKNNNKSLKSGDGKLMITSGLSIHDFVQKYHL